MKRLLFVFTLTLTALAAFPQITSRIALRKLNLAEYAISQLYVDSVDENSLVEEAIKKMLSQLDPHSTYNNAEEVKEMNKYEMIYILDTTCTDEKREAFFVCENAEAIVVNTAAVTSVAERSSRSSRTTQKQLP